MSWGPQAPFSFEEFLNSPLWQLVKTLINSILLKQILTLFTVYAIISYIKKEGEIYMFIYLKGIYYNTIHILSAEKIGKTITVEIVNGKKETVTYDNTETAGNEFKKIIGKEE